MKSIKYLFIGALMTVMSAPAMAQATIDDAIKAIKSNITVKEKEAAIKAAKLDKKNPALMAKIGRAFLDVKDTLSARKYADLAIKTGMKNPANSVGYILLGDIEVFNDNPGEAAVWYQNAMMCDEKNAEAYKKYAFIYRGRDPRQAVETLERLRQVDPTYPVDAEAGHIYYLSASKSDEYLPLALQSYQKVSLDDLAKLENGYLTEYALVAFISQKNADSKKAAEYGLKAKPRNAGYNRLAMYNSVELKQFEDAVKYVDALFNKSDSVELSGNDYKFAALAYTGVENHEQALAMRLKQKEVAETAEAKALIMKDISDTYRALGEMDKALEAYDEFITKNPNTSANDYAGYANIYRNLSAAEGLEAAAKEEYINKAVSIYMGMIEKFPTSADYSNFMAARTIQALDADQKKGLAVPYYTALFQSISAAGIKDKSDTARITEACQYLGIYYFKIKNDNDSAKPYFLKLQEIDPENALAKQVLEILK